MTFSGKKHIYAATLLFCFEEIIILYKNFMFDNHLFTLSDLFNLI